MRLKPIDFYYFSGTGNTLLVVKKMRDAFIRKGIETNLYRLETADPLAVNLEHTIGLAFPVAAQATYPFVWKFAKNLPPASGTHIFMVDTLAGFSGGIVGPLRKLVQRKGYIPIGAREIIMPSNLLVRSGAAEKNKKKIEKGMQKAAEYASQLATKTARWGRIPGLPNIFNLIGTSRKPWNFMRKHWPLSVDTGVCIKCGLCAKLCPVANITMNEHPVFSDHCEICMRCISFCPVQAIRMNDKKINPYSAVKAQELLENNP